MFSTKNKVSVVYLAWLPYGITYFKKFINSYLASNAGFEHELIIAFNGVSEKNKNQIDFYLQYLKENNIEGYTIQQFNSGQDLEIYYKVAKKIDSDYVLFLNTYSEVRTENWLYFFIKNIKDNVGLIGASGSYADYIRSINLKIKNDLLTNIPLTKKIKLLKYFLKINLFYKNKFSGFPNPHIRTNAFFLKRELFCDLEFPEFKTKMNAYYFENGMNSLTNQVLRRGLKCIIIDNSGKSYDIPEWPSANIFWQNSQQGLLISDNQTAKYMSGSISLKKQLRKEAWNAE